MDFLKMNNFIFVKIHRTFLEFCLLLTKVGCNFLMCCVQMAVLHQSSLSTVMKKRGKERRILNKEEPRICGSRA